MAEAYISTVWHRVLLTHFAGELCEEVDDCASEPCENGGQCESLGPLGIYCQCREGYTGHSCEYDIDECVLSNVCLNGGTCVNTNGSYRLAPFL